MSKAMPLFPLWPRAVLVCAAIPALWAMELWIGVLLLHTPEVIYGDALDVFGLLPESAVDVALVLAVFWIIVKTPFEVISLAFSPNGRATNREGGRQQ